MQLETCGLKLLGNEVDITGGITVLPEDINNSELNLRVSASELALASFEEIIAAVIPNSLKHQEKIKGVLEVLIDITGTFTETLITVNAETDHNQPIRLGTYAPPIALKRLQADTHLNSESLRIRSIVANGKINDGSYWVQGDASFSVQDIEALKFAIDVSASKLEISDLVPLLSEQPSPVQGTVSGNARVTGTGLLPHQITVIGTGHLPLQLPSSAMTAAINLNIAGTLAAPEITADWHGTINEKEWTGDVQYRDERINLLGIELKTREDRLTLSGVIPFNLTFAAMEVADRFLSLPIDVRLRGSELPLNFFPGVDSLFSEANGTVDIDVAVQGTSREPYAVGNLFLEALELHLKNFHAPIQNTQVQLKVHEGGIDVTNLRFDIAEGSCRLEQGQLVLNGLTPKQLALQGLKLERFPLGSTVRHALPSELLAEVEGHLTTTLNELTVPFDRFLTNGASIPLPQIREIPSLADLIAVSAADVSIDNVRFAFKALDRRYDFQDPQTDSDCSEHGDSAIT